MKLIHHPAPAPGPVRRLIILLPGAFSRAEDFATEGLIADLNELAPATDALAVDALPAYFSDPQARVRLAEVVAQARQTGHQTIHLAGISLGGMGALLHEVEHGRTAPVDGLIALAPYVGTREALAEVRAAGGLRTWRPGPACAGWERSLLVSLQFRLGHLGAGAGAAATGSSSPQTTPTPLTLAWGEDDRFADSIRTIADCVPAPQRIVLPGAHDWPTWRRLWRELLSRSDLCR